MNRDPPCCTPYPSSSDSNVGSDGGKSGGPGVAAGICGFGILDVQKLRDGGDGTDPAAGEEPGESGPLAGFSHGGVPQISNGIRVKEEPNEDFHSLGGSVVVVKVEPDPTNYSSSEDFNVEVKVKREHADDCSFQGEMPSVEARCLPVTTSFTSQGTLDGTLVKPEPCHTSLFAGEEQEKHVENRLSSYNNFFSKYNTRSKGSSQNSCEDSKSNHCPVRKSQFKCRVCKMVFPHHSQLTAHKVVHPDVKRYKCPVCEKAFVHSSQLDMHKIVHAAKKPYNCSVCQKAFLSSTYLKMHLKIHTGETSNKCCVCEKTFCTQYYLKTHQKIHSEENSFRCSICNQKLSTSYYVQKHELICTGRKTLSCSFCNKVFSCLSYLQKHMKICTGEKTFRCHVCKMVFSSLFYLQNHKIIHISKNIFDSPLCKEMSSSSSYLKEDEVVHTSENTFTCSFDKKASNVSHLNVDETIPTDEKTLDSPFCKKVSC
uniref:C2H2-type domain-containing protein n=1 Tax=Eptatretus burgeri TaxID=7764 RepID=A0A8C4R0M5_EPTBU